MARLSLTFIVLISFVSTALTVANAFFLKKQFYPSVVYLIKSPTSMTILYFQAAVLSYIVFSLLRWIFFGQLRAAEIEHAQERVWHAIMETCLAFTVFRDEFSPKFVMQFVLLFFVKAFHWLAEDRVEYMERSPVITLLFHARIMGILSLLTAVDSYFISHAFFTTLLRGATAQIIFGFEYAILFTIVIHVAINYLLHVHDLRAPHPWENKAVYMLYAELFTSFLRCVLYIIFYIVMIKMHTFPLFSFRPFYLTIRSLKKAINDVLQSRRAINAMNTLFPLATAQELAETDNTCIICREEMTVESGAKKLPCNHIFHPNCLRSWFQRQQTCPTCRSDILAVRRPLDATANQPVGEQHNVPRIVPQLFPFNGMINQQPFQRMNMPFGYFPPPFQPNFIPPAFFLANNMAPQFQPGGNATIEAAQLANQNAQQPTTSQSHSAQQQQQSPSASQQPPNQTPLQFPPSGFMPPYFPPPPFPRPPTTAGLSEAEILLLEGTERRNVEARIEVLRNITTLLDAAMLQIQQYMGATNSNFLSQLSTTQNLPPQNVNAKNETPSTSNQSESSAEHNTTVNNGSISHQ